MLPAPAFVIKIVLGLFDEALICSQRALSTVLQDAGFHFSYGDIDAALDEIVEG